MKAGQVGARTQPRQEAKPSRHGVVPAKRQKKRVALDGSPLTGSGGGNFSDFLYRSGPEIHNPQVYAHVTRKRETFRHRPSLLTEDASDSLRQVFPIPPQLPAIVGLNAKGLIRRPPCPR
jgi:hypothetical protein